MITIKIKFECEDKPRTLTAILNNQWELSTNKRNQATDIVDDSDDERWSIVFEIDEQLFEAVMYKDEERQKLPSVDYVIVWDSYGNGGILSEVNATSTVKYS